MKITHKEHFVLITPEDGFITTFKEGDDILTFDASIMVYAPLTADLSAYREISAEEKDRLQAEKEAAEQIERPENE